MWCPLMLFSLVMLERCYLFLKIMPAIIMDRSGKTLFLNWESVAATLSQTKHEDSLTRTLDTIVALLYAKYGSEIELVTVQAHRPGFVRPPPRTAWRKPSLEPSSPSPATASFHDLQAFTNKLPLKRTSLSSLPSRGLCPATCLGCDDRGCLWEAARASWSPA